MSCTSRKKLEALLFNYNIHDVTTTKIELPKQKLRSYPKTDLKPKRLSGKPTQQEHTLKDIHTLTKIHNQIPFDLFTRPHPIVRHDPWKPMEIHSFPGDEDHDEVQKTRPRVVLTPQVKMDDMGPKDRDILVKDMYSTDIWREQQNAVIPAASRFRVDAPMTPLPAPARPIRLRKPELPYISPEWRMGTLTWDRKQSREYCDATQTFWLNRPNSNKSIHY